MGKDTRYGHFGESASRALADRRMSQLDLARSLDLSASYVNQAFTGKKKPSARWADLVASALGLSEDERRELHAAAAKDNGFKL
jgi:transcriptional regulator with XRE-family HTH domain